MARLIHHSLRFLLFLAVGMAVTAAAQSTQQVKANIPFDFSFDGRTFPAGEYQLVQPLQHTLELRNAQGHTLGRVFTNSLEGGAPVEASKLRFEFTGGQYFLREVWHEQASSGERLNPEKSRTKVAKHRAPGNQPSAEGGQE